MADDEKKIPASFYIAANGAEPVRDWLKSLSKFDRRVIGIDIKTAEFGWPIGMPLCRSVSAYNGLWEIRSALPRKRIARIFFCTHDNQLVLLHGFFKKTRKAPKADLELAADRMRELKARSSKKNKENRK